METALTREIKNLTHTYKPKMGHRTEEKKNGRTIRYADEVWTPNGIVDSIRFEDYIISRNEECLLENYESSDLFKKQEVERILNERNFEPGHCKIKGASLPNRRCAGCFFRKRGEPVIGMLITAFEVKITKSDFRSKNGHNIDDPRRPIANENYYCMPKDLVPEVAHLIPEHVGILAYHNGRLRKCRPAVYQDVPDDVKILLLYNSLKKWCDGAMKKERTTYAEEL